MAKKELEVWGPDIGCWSETESCDPPPACCILGLFLSSDPHVKVHMGDVRRCNAFYYRKGVAIDPDEKQHDCIRWFVDDKEVDPPFAWAEMRYVIPLGLAWKMAHGIKKKGKVDP